MTLTSTRTGSAGYDAMGKQSRSNVIVGTTNKSIEASVPAWFLKNVRQVCDGGLG